LTGAALPPPCCRRRVAAALAQKFCGDRFRDYFCPRNENRNEKYKADQEAPPTGKVLIVLYSKIIRAFLREGSFVTANSWPLALVTGARVVFMNINKL